MIFLITIIKQYHAGTHGIAFDEKDAGDEDFEDHTSEHCTIETDVPFETLMRGEFNLIYSHPEALFKTRFAKLLRSKLFFRISEW